MTALISFPEIFEIQIFKLRNVYIHVCWPAVFSTAFEGILLHFIAALFALPVSGKIDHARFMWKECEANKAETQLKTRLRESTGGDKLHRVIKNDVISSHVGISRLFSLT